MKKDKLLVILVVVLVAINATTIGLLVSKPNYERPEHPKFEGPKAKIIERLQFDQNQIEQFHRLIEDHETNIERLDKKRFNAKVILYESLSEDTSNLNNLYADLGLIQEEIERTHIAHFNQIKAICREEQIPFFIELTKDFGKLFNQRPKRGARPPLHR